MAITIIRQGRLPETTVYAGKCSRCETAVECLRGDTKPRDGGRNETDHFVPCPLPGCNAEILVFEKR